MRMAPCFILMSFFKAILVPSLGTSGKRLLKTSSDSFQVFLLSASARKAGHCFAIAKLGKKLVSEGESRTR